MRRLLRLAFASFVVLSACAPPDTALKVTVQVQNQGSSRVRADCLKLAVSSETQELKSLTIKLPADGEAIFGVRRGQDLPATVKLQAFGYFGDCADESSLKLNAQGSAVTMAFPEKGVGEVTVLLEPPNSSLDADRDGYVAASKNGIDCRDDDGTIYPGANQICSMTSDTDCDGQGGCDDSECSTATVCADPPDRVIITTSITEMMRYECKGPFTVSLANAGGARIAVRDTAVALETDRPGVTVHAVSNCMGNPVTSLPIAYGERSFNVYLKVDGLALGPTRLRATAAKVMTPGAVTIEVLPQPVVSLAFTSPPRTVRAGECSTEQVTLELRDSEGRRTDVTAPTTVSMRNMPGDLNPTIFFSDAACTVDSTTTQLQPGQGAVALYVMASRAGLVTITADPAIVPSQAQPLTVQPAAPSKLAYTNGSLVLNTTQTCSPSPLTIEVRDQFDNPVPVAADLPIRVSETTGLNVEFLATATCMGSPQSDYVITAGATAVPVYARAMTARSTPGSVRAAVTNGAAITPALQDIGVSAGAASAFVLSGGPESPLASVCSGNPFRIELRDAANNPASSMTATTFTLSTLPASTDSTFGFFTGAGCQTALNNTLTIPPGQSSATFYFRGNKSVTNFEVRAASTLTAPSTGLSGNQIRPNVPGRLVFTTPLSQTAQAGACTASTFNANVLDLFDNVTSFPTAQTVTVAPSPIGPRVGNGACDQGSVVLPANTSQVTFNAGHNVTGTYGLVATVNGFSTSSGVQLTVTPGPSTLTADVPLNGTTNIVAGNCQVITLARRDTFMNNAPVTGNQAVTVTLPPSTDWQVFATNNCTGTVGAPISMNATHTVTFSVIPRTSGLHQLRASIGAAATLQTANVNFNVSPAAPTLVFETPATNVGTASATQTAGGCTPVTVARKDTFGNDVPLGSAQNVTFTLPAGTTVHTGTPCTVSNAVTSLALTASDARASFFVSATRSAATGGPQLQSVVTSLASQGATLSLTVNPGAPTLRVATPANGTATTTANTCVPVTVERRDALNNLVPTSSAMNLTVSPTTNLALFNNSDCSGPTATLAVASGSSTRSFGLRTDLVNPNLALTLGLDGQTAPLTLTINPGPLAVLTVLGLPASMTAGGCVGPLTVRRRDNFTNDITNGAATVVMSSTPFTFSTANDCSGATAGLNVNLADGASTSGAFYARATATGTAAMTATIGSVNGSASLTVNPATPTLSVVTPAGGTATVTAASCVPVTVERRDAFNNLVPTSGALNLTVTPGSNLSVFSATDCSGSAITNVPVTSGASSRAFSVRTSVANPSLVLSVNLDGQSDTLTLTVNPGPASTLVVQGLPSSMTSGGCVGPITLRRRDASANDVTSGAATVTLTSTAFSFSTASDCSGATTGGSVNIADTQSVSGAFYVTATTAGTASFTATAGGASGTGSLTVNAGPPAQYVLTTGVRTLTAGACSGVTNAISVQLKDAAGNNTVAGGNVVITATSSSGTGLWFTTTNCSAQAAGGAFTITTGSGAISLFYRDNTAGPFTVTLTNGAGLTNPANQVHTVNPAAAARLVFTTAARTFTAAQCGGAGNVITVRLEDAFGNAVPAGGSGQVFTAASNSTGTATFFTNDTCATTAAGGNFTIPNGQSTVNLYYRDTKVGSPTVSLTNASSLSNPTPQPHSVLVGAASQLAFTTAVQNTVPALGCSGAVDVELRDAGGNPVTVTGTRTVTMTATLAANVTWYSDSSCTTALTGGDATITNGNASVRVYFRAENTGAITLTAASTGVSNGTQGATIIAANPSKLVVTTADATVEAGFCQLVTVQRQDSLSRPANPASATTVTPAVAPTTGLSYFSDASCATALGATFTIASGQSSANVYVKGTQASLSGTTPGSQLYTLTFTAPSLTQDTSGITVLPMARRRSTTCQIGANQQTTTCAITPTLSDISRTMLFFQAAAGDADDSPSEDHVTCALQMNGSAAEMACTRSVNTGAALDIEWQTLSFPYPSSQAGGVSVQHLSGGCAAAATSAMPINTSFTANPSATTGNTFVLFSHRSTGPNNDFEHHFTGRLTTTSNFRVDQAASSSTCSVTMGFTAQVVTWNGAAVVRGVQAGGSGASFTATATSTTNRSFVLHSSRMATSDNSSQDICRRRLKSEVTNGTTLTFTRGCTGSDVQDIAWELITVPATASVATLGGNTSNNGNNINLAMSGADLARGVAFLSGMGPGGTANSATDYNSGDQVGAAQGRAVVNNSSQVGVARPGSDGVGQYSGFFLQVTP